MATISNYSQSVILGAVILIMSGCASNSTKILSAAGYDKTTKYSQVQIKNHQPMELVPQEQVTYLTKRINDLYLENGFPQGDGLIVNYSITSYNEGSRALRYFVGFGVGKAELVVETSFYDAATNKLIGKVESRSDLSRGAFGGSFNEVLDKVAMEIFEFSKKNYLNLAGASSNRQISQISDNVF
jgi:hypothetical protein